jgi:hypothetical protein
MEIQMSEEVSRTLITPTFRMSFPNLIQPKQFQGKGDYFYNMEMIYNSGDMTKFKMPNDETGEFVDVDIKQVCAEVAREKWGLDVSASVKDGTLGWPIKDGSKLAIEREEAGKKSVDHYVEMKVINCKAYPDYPPKLFYQDEKTNKRKMVVRGLESDEAFAANLFYGGAYAFGELTVRSAVSGGKKYVTCYINSVRFMSHGDRLGGGSLIDRFEGIHGGSGDYDPTKNMSSGVNDDLDF